jgi:uncharacterized protein
MPEYLAPGVYVEEVSFRSKAIEGVSTTTTGFIGPTRYGPVDLEPELITSLGEFERIYGDGQQLQFGDQPGPLQNYVWHAVRAFFEEGGKRLYVVRVFKPTAATDGRAGVTFPAGAPRTDPLPQGDLDTDETRYRTAISIRARFPGAAGRLRIRFTVGLGQNLLGREPVPGQPGQFRPTVAALQPNDIVWIGDIGSPIQTQLGSPIWSPLELPAHGAFPERAGRFYRAGIKTDEASGSDRWVFYATSDDEDPALALEDLDSEPPSIDEVRVLTLSVTVFPSDPFDLPQVWSDLPLHPDHKQRGTNVPDSLTHLFALHPPVRAQEYRLPTIVSLGRDLCWADGLSILDTASKPGGPVDANGARVGILEFLARHPAATDIQRSFDFVLSGGDDGDRPSASEYEGEAPQNANYKSGLKAFEDIDDISIVAAPGSTYGLENGYRADATTIVAHLIAHAMNMRYRIAVIDSGEGQALSQVRAMRAKLDSKYAALYYPWVRVLDPITRREIDLPPSGFVAGIYARNDITRAVYKAPANEVVMLALGFEQLLNKAQQDVLNPEGINCFRFFEGRGFRLWGARTLSSDPEWKYVNLRRYFAYLEHSIDKGTQWAVFEPNGELLWANVRRTIEDFLFNEWQNGALLGDKPEKAFFVRCDRTTMTQNDLDNGRLVVLIGVVPLRPAEFVIFRIGQATADSMRRG